MCDRELDQPLLSLTFLSPLSVETDIILTGRINTANSCTCHHGKDGCVVDRALCWCRQ